MPDERRPDAQQEPVHAPHRDTDPPKRSPAAVIWVTVAIAAILVLGIALVVAAVSAA